MRHAPHPFWRFSLRVYRAAGVQQACLALQEDCGADVNLLLLCGWLVQSTRPLIERIFSPYGLHLDWRFFYGWEIAVVFAVVCGLGALGAWLAGSRHLLNFKARS